MIDLLRDIVRAVIEIIKAEIAWRRFLRDLNTYPPFGSKWQDAVSKVTVEAWRAKVKKLGYSRLVATPESPKPKPHAKRKRTKFKKRWPHGRHSG